MVGADGNVPPLEAPQTPLIGDDNLEAVQLSLVPPFAPSQLHSTDPPSAGNAGSVGLAVPVVQIVSVPYEVADAAYVFSAVPQTPVIGGKGLEAVQLALVPSLAPLQDQLIDDP